MTILRISTRDARTGYARPVALIDRATNDVVSCFRSLADATRAKILIEQIAVRGFSAGELHELAATTCDNLHGSREYERLALGQFTNLITAIQTDLLARRKRGF